MTGRVAHQVDHLVLAVPDLADGARRLEALLGVDTEPGGRHQGLGTHNRLVGLGPETYLELVAPDPTQPPPERPRWFGLDTLSAPRMVTWCVRGADLVAIAERGRAAGIDLGDPVSGSRLRDDGSRLAWTFTDPWTDRAGGVVPFFIDWGPTEHPGARLKPSCSLRDLRIEHPSPDRVRAWLDALGLDVTVDRGEAPRVVAVLDTPGGVVEIR